MRILNAAQMREADRFTIEDIGIPSLVLMENAGRQVVAAMEAAYESRLNGRVAVLCGRGNNGGDGFVVARTLLQRGIDAAVFVIGALTDVRGDAKTNLEILGRLGVTVVEIGDEQTWELHFSEISQCTLIVDAIFGTGLKSALGGMMETVVADVNASSIPIVSIDLPSGLSADTPHLIGDCIDASMTVTLAAPKLPLVLPPGEAHAGDVVIADIGIPHDVIDGVEGRHIELLTPEQLREVVEPRAADSHKGDFGRVTIVAGSRGKTGAAHLSAMGALRSGAGLVTVATPGIVAVDRRVDGAGVHDRAARGIGRRLRRARRDRSGAGDEPRRDRLRARARARPRRRGVRPRCSTAPPCRSCSTRTRSPCLPTIPGGWSAGKSAT